MSDVYGLTTVRSKPWSALTKLENADSAFGLTFTHQYNSVNDILTTIEEDCFMLDSLKIVGSIFAYRVNVTSRVPELWTLVNVKEDAYSNEEAFYHCTKVANYDDIPDLWK